MRRNIQEDFINIVLWAAFGFAAWWSMRWFAVPLEEWVVYLIAVNAATFLLYGLDKMFAQWRSWRVSERVLFLTALLFGSVGAIAGMQFFRHKTRKTSFQLILACIVLLQIGAIV